jgi:Saxitoxin biosynthesis operon protein SxtJ
MSLIRLNTKPSPRDLRVFGLLSLIFLGTFGAIAWHKGEARAAWGFWVAGGLITGPGMVYPPWLRYVYLSAIYVSYPFGVVSSVVILGVVYYLVLTPVGWILRLSGKDPLSRKFLPGQQTYWKRRGPAKSAQDYFRQY